MARAREEIQGQAYPLQAALPLVQKLSSAKFDETVEISLRLGVDPRHADQMVRGTVVLPHGLGKSKKVCVIASGEKQREAEQAGKGPSTWGAKNWWAGSRVAGWTLKRWWPPPT